MFHWDNPNIRHSPPHLAHSNSNCQVNFSGHIGWWIFRENTVLHEKLQYCYAYRLPIHDTATMYIRQLLVIVSVSFDISIKSLLSLFIIIHLLFIWIIIYQHYLKSLVIVTVSSLIVVVPVLRHSKCLTDDECRNIRPNAWETALTEIVALSEEKSKAAIATFKEAKVDPPELLLCKQAWSKLTIIMY